MTMKTETWFDYLPDHLLLEILYKLPYKSIFKFLSVSKQWHSLISDPSFAPNYCSHTRIHSVPQLTFIRRTMYVEKSKLQLQDPPEQGLLNNISISSNNCYSVLAFPRKQHDHTKRWLRYELMDTSNGLWLCASKSIILGADQVNFYICNPLTKQWITLPPPTQRHRSNLNIGFSTKLGEFLTVTSYKVVIFVKVAELIEFEVFSSETDRWDVHMVNPQVLDRWADKAIAKDNGLLAWPNKDCTRLLTYNPYLDTNTCEVVSLEKNQVLVKYSRENVLPFTVPAWPTTIKLVKE